MAQEDTFLGRLKAPASPGAVDEAVLAAAQTAAKNLKAGNNGEPQPVAGAKKSYDGPSSGKAAGAAKGGARESSMETITFPCPACGTKYSVPAQHAGKSTPCKKCGASITVPMPQVANPTIIGGTRTIRRSDIEDASTSERAAPVMKKATGQVPKQGTKRATANFGDVDMKGGESVLRKEETVVQTGAGTRPHPSRVPPPPTRGGPRPVQGGRPAPMPGQPGYGAPKPKNPMPLYAGIGGGVVLVIIIIAVVVMNSGGPKQSGNSATTDSTTGGPPQLSDDERLLKQYEMDLKNVIGLTTADFKDKYKQAKERAAASGKFTDKFKDYKNQFAQLLAGNMNQSGASKTDVRDVALMLFNDGYQDIARPLIDKARSMMSDKDRFTSENYDTVDSTGEKITKTRKVSTATYKQICEILGLVEYKYPEDQFMDYYIWDLPEYSDWAKKFSELTEGPGKDTFLTKAEFDTLMIEHEKLDKAGKALIAQDKIDGFAIEARKAFLRFKRDNQDTSKRAMFSPKMLQRPGEKFEDVWGYTYWKPFIVFVEKAPGRDVDDLKKSFATKANLLMQEEKWFRKNIIEAFGLKRVLPFIGPTTRRVGDKIEKFDTPGELAEAEGWPLEINVLKDGQTFQQFMVDQMGGGIPGARAFYSNPLKHVVTWDDPNASEGDDQAWFNECVIIHETFHMLTDHYAAKPVEWDWKYGERDENGVRKKDWFPKENRARLFNVFVQEGLTDSVAGFEKEGDGAKATYNFLMHNRVRIPDWQQTYKALDNSNLFRIQDLLKCVHYGHFGSVGNECWKRIGQDKKRKGYPDPNLYFGVYYASACQASAFLYHYKENGTLKYRDKWLAYIKMDYSGAVDRGDYSPEPGIKAFKEAFGIKSDADFDKMEAELVKWTLTLKADGSDDQMSDKDAIGDAPDLPGPMDYVPERSEQWALLRKERELAA